MDPIIFVTAAAHMFYTPFTKVEESFNLQAMHDILYWRHNITQYDHHEYPGVVPRTFLGPLFISILSTPFVLLFEALHINKFWAQYVVRLVLAAVISVAWNNLRKTLTKLFDNDVCMWLTMITLSQFHFMFYMSRPLPNILALPIVLYALACWFKGATKSFIIFSGIAIIIFRSELAIFLGLLLAYDILFRKIKVDKVLKIAIPAAIVILATTIMVDSFFWQRLVWPEGEVLWYNTILNKSSDWGTSPFLWYFYSALPRAMGVSLLFVPVGFYLESRIRPIVFAALCFVLIYSLLPHKELRFIIYIFPILNLATACACNRFWMNSAKSMWHSFLALCAGGHLLLNILITLFLLVVSGTNYPGGVAMSRLHRLEAHTANVSVHIANLAAQSGVSRFMEIRDDWRYCKNETLNYNHEDLMKYTHLLVEAKSKYNIQMWNSLQEEFDAVEFVDCFNSIGIQYNSLLPVRVKTKPCISILKRRKNSNLILKEKQNLPMDEKSIVEPLTMTIELLEEVQTLPVLEAGSKISKNDSLEIENVSLEANESTEEKTGLTKEINFLELRNLAMGKATKKTTKATKQKLKQIIEQYYRAKGSVIENDSLEIQSNHKRPTTTIETPPNEPKAGIRHTVKSIIRQEKIKEMIEQIAQMDLMSMCDLNKLTTKECLRQVIDKLDSDDHEKF